MEEDRFKISLIFVSLFLIAAWIGITYFYGMILVESFHWTILFYLPLYLCATWLFFINSVQLIIEEIKKLKRKHE